MELLQEALNEAEESCNMVEGMAIAKENAENRLEALKKELLQKDTEIK